MRRLAAVVLATILAVSAFPPAVHAADGEPAPGAGAYSMGSSSSDASSGADTSRASADSADSADLPDVDMHADSGRVLKVAFPQAKGVSETDRNGIHTGIFYDWLVEISKYTGWSYEFVSGDVEDLLPGVLAGEYDLVGGMFYP